MRYTELEEKQMKEIEQLKIELLISKNVCQSKSDARRLIAQGAYDHAIQKAMKEGQ